VNLDLPPLDPEHSADARVVLAVARAAATAGGRALLVGGFVRDALLSRLGRGQPSKDLDVEVFGVPLDGLREMLARLGAVDEVGASFAVLRIRGIDVDFSLPRADTKEGEGHRGFLVAADPAMSYSDAARRRDFTLNSISLDPLTGEVIDPVGGVGDLTAGVLRATDVSTFGEDPLRALRAVQMAARFRLEPAPELPGLMAQQDLAELPAERLEQELRKLLLRGVQPSLGIALLRAGDCVSALPGLGCSEAIWAQRSEALDRWATERSTRATALAEGWTLLTWDATAEDRRALLRRVRPPLAIQRAIEALSEPHALPQTEAQSRSLARRIGKNGVTLAGLLGVRSALGDPVGQASALASGAGVLHAPPTDVVMGRHLVATGFAPGPAFAGILARCRALQDETGLTDPDAILAQVLPSKS